MAARTDPTAPGEGGAATTEGDVELGVNDRGAWVRNPSEYNGASSTKQRRWLWKRKPPPPPPESLDDVPEIPLATAGILSRLTFRWLSPLIHLGFKRPLQATDLWKMDASRQSYALSDKFLANLDRRQRRAAEWNANLGTVRPGWFRRAKWNVEAAWPYLPSQVAAFGPQGTYSQRRATLETEWRRMSGIKHGSVAWAINDTFYAYWYLTPYVLVDRWARIVMPLIVKQIIVFAEERRRRTWAGGCRWRLDCFLQLLATGAMEQGFFRCIEEGFKIRSTLISATYKRAFQLSVPGRAQNPDGKLMTHLSADITRIDLAAQYVHTCWAACLDVVIVIILLCTQIGPAGLVGAIVFMLAAPTQTRIMTYGVTLRKRLVMWTEKRSKLLQELLPNMPILKMFTYEVPYLKRITDMRRHEMRGIRSLLFTRAAGEAVALSLPTIAAVFAFIMYTSLHPNFNTATIFAALLYFNRLGQPIVQIPRALSIIMDALNASRRMSPLFEAPLKDDEVVIDPSLAMAVHACNASFQWESSGEAGTEQEQGGRKRVDEAEMPEPTASSEPFAIRNLDLQIPRGALVAIVGPVGSGKSNVLQGLLGEMRCIGGSVEFGGRIGYCQQSALIQNATVRDNIVFGQAWDEARYWQCIRDASLAADLELMPGGDLTEIGEKGINLSGGQKQRINIARALYYNADVLLLDDPLSAVDAHVGKALFNDAILGLKRAGKTVVLVTHALHFLPQVDFIYAMTNGRIVEQGTYLELMDSGDQFSQLMDTYGGVTEQPQAQGSAGHPLDCPVIEECIEEEEKAMQDEVPAKMAGNGPKDMGKAASEGILEGRLMTAEERKTGAVGFKVYAAYFTAGNVLWLVPAVILMTIMEGSMIMSTVWLTYWQEDKFRKAAAFYQGIYAMLGCTTALFTLLAGMAMTVLSVNASQNLYGQALGRIFKSPMSFFDSTPLGRILGIFGKDVDTLDNEVPQTLRLVVLCIAMLIGPLVIVTINFPYFIAVAFGVAIGYLYFAFYYRRSAREIKRLDSMFRSTLYAHFSESLAGLAVIRAYGETERFTKENAAHIDMESRAFLLTRAEHWLSLRLDGIGSLLILALALMCTAGTRDGSIDAAQVALCLTYMLTISSQLANLAYCAVDMETSMNGVERILYYCNDIPQEAAHETAEDAKLSDRWPANGVIDLDKVVMSYRPTLPPVLKGISVSIMPGERVGIVGRTGAGKTSITIALYRLAELSSGTITIDGVDASTLGLTALRSSIAIIPQDPVLFSGTLRSNLDPFDRFDDEQRYDAMERASLVAEARVDGDQGRNARFVLDMPIEHGGANLSVGERSLVSLARALVKDAYIMVLDEATAAVDLETDAKIQNAIRVESIRGQKTLLCIAHRLRTIIGWDRILVMDAGEVREFASPLELFDRPDGLFRSMCERSGITRMEIIRTRKGYCSPGP